MPRRVEVQHHTPEQVQLTLAAALELVDEIRPPDDLRVVFFTKAVDLLATKTVQIVPDVPGGLPVAGLPLLGGH